MREQKRKEREAKGEDANAHYYEDMQMPMPKQARNVINSEEMQLKNMAQTLQVESESMVSRR